MNQAIIGLGFGDEGKGLVTDLLSSQNNIKYTGFKADNKVVTRFSGGQQAGHTVVIGDRRHVFSNFGSGTLRNIPTYWSKYCTVDPVGILNELVALEEFPQIPVLYIDPECPVTTPWDKYYNQNSKKYEEHGTCGAGVGATWQREEDFRHLKFRDLYNPTAFKLKCNAIEDYYSGTTGVEDFKMACRAIVRRGNIKPRQLETFQNQPNTHMIFEGSQGLLLDQHYGFFPHVTRSNTGTKNIIEMGYRPELFLVTRAYQTRHGNGPMTNMDIDYKIKTDGRETNKVNPYQGQFRRSMLDLDLLIHGISSDPYIAEKAVNKQFTLVVTCLDHLEGGWGFTKEGEEYYFNNKKGFLQAIKDTLGAKYLLYSESPESRNIKTFNDYE